MGLDLEKSGMSYSQYLRSTMSKNWADAHSQVLNLYRKSLRAIPSLIVQYELDLDPRVMGKRIRANLRNTRMPTICVMLINCFSWVAWTWRKPNPCGNKPRTWNIISKRRTST